MAHENTKRSSAAIEITISRLVRDRLSQQRVREQNTVPLLGKLPSGAGAGYSSTDDGNGGDQFRACSGMTAA